MKRKSVAAVLLVLLCSTSFVEARESWVGLNLRVQPVYFETNKLNGIVWGGGAEASWFLHKRLLVEGRYSTSFLYNEAKSDYTSYRETDPYYDESEPTPDIKPFTYWEAGGQLNLIIKSGTYRNDVSYNVITKTWTDPVTGEYKVQYKKKSGPSFYTNEYRLYGIRGGIFGLNSGTAADVGKESDTIKDADGIVLSGLDTLYTNHTMTGFYVGIVRTRVFYSEGLWNSWYIDLLVSSDIKFEDPKMTGFTDNQFGGRFGFEGARRHVGGRVEGGVRPGVGGFFILVQASFGLMI